MVRVAVVLALSVLIVLLAAGCSVVRMQERAYTRKFQRAALTQHTVQLNGATVRYWEGGEGPPLLLLHGFGAHAVFQWYDQVGPFARNHRVIVPDLLYFGGSSGVDGEYSLTHQAETFLALMDHLDVERAHVVGISYGGLVTWQLATQHPGRFERVVLVDSPGASFTDADFEQLLADWEVESPAEIVVPASPSDVRRLLKLAYHRPPPIPGFILKDVMKNLYSDQMDEKVALLAHLTENADVYRDMAEPPTQPVLLVWGDGDPLFPLPIAERLSGELNAQLVIIEKARHAPNLERPKPFNTAVLRFLEP